MTMQATQVKNPEINEIHRMHFRQMNLLLDERLRGELAKPGFWGTVKLEVTIQNGVIKVFDVSSTQTVRTTLL